MIKPMAQPIWTKTVLSLCSHHPWTLKCSHICSSSANYGFWNPIQIPKPNSFNCSPFHVVVLKWHFWVKERCFNLGHVDYKGLCLSFAVKCPFCNPMEDSVYCHPCVFCQSPKLEDCKKIKVISLQARVTEGPQVRTDIPWPSLSITLQKAGF